MYSRAMDLDVSLSTRVVRATPPAERGERAGASDPARADASGSGHDDDRWTVRLQREGHEDAWLHPSHVIFATGMSGYPRVPDTPGEFDGESLHSSAYPGAAGGRFAGRRAVV
eukprot:1537227-Prymnesium_polylepis.1